MRNKKARGFCFLPIACTFPQTERVKHLDRLNYILCEGGSQVYIRIMSRGVRTILLGEGPQLAENMVAFNPPEKNGSCRQDATCRSQVARLDSQVARQADSQAARQGDRQTGRQTGRETDICAER